MGASQSGSYSPQDMDLELLKLIIHFTVEDRQDYPQLQYRAVANGYTANVEN